MSSEPCRQTPRCDHDPPRLHVGSPLTMTLRACKQSQLAVAICARDHMEHNKTAQAGDAAAAA